MHIRTIIRLLENGWNPEDISDAEEIGDAGSYRTAYLIGNYVVKLSNRASGQGHRHRIKLPKGVRYPDREWKVGKWVIQRYYEPISYDDWAERFPDGCYHDFHDENLGYDSKGRLVAFDW